MGHPSKVSKACRNARLIKSSRTCKPLVPIDINSIIVEATINKQVLKDQPTLDPNNNTTDFSSCASKPTFFELNITPSLENDSESPTLCPMDNISETLDIGIRSLLEISDFPDVQSDASIESLSKDSNLS